LEEVEAEVDLDAAGPGSRAMPVQLYSGIIQQLKQQKHELQLQTLAEQRRLRTTENFSQAVLSNLPSGVLVFGTNGLVKQANPAAKDILGFRSLPGMSAQDIFRGAEASASAGSEASAGAGATGDSTGVADTQCTAAAATTPAAERFTTAAVMREQQAHAADLMERAVELAARAAEFTTVPERLPGPLTETGRRLADTLRPAVRAASVLGLTAATTMAGRPRAIPHVEESAPVPEQRMPAVVAMPVVVTGNRGSGQVSWFATA